MENQQSSVEALLDRTKSYVETRMDLLRLKAIDKSSSFLSLLVSMIVVILVSLLTFMFLFIGIALLIGDLLGKSYYGFLIIAGFFLITGIVVFALRDKLLKTPMVNAMIKKLME